MTKPRKDECAECASKNVYYEENGLTNANNPMKNLK